MSKDNLGFDPERKWTPRIVARQQTPCWPWRLRDKGAIHPIGECCVECGQDVALEPALRGYDPVCLYCALDNGTLPAIEIEPGDERSQHAIAMETRKAETGNTDSVAKP